MLTRVMAGRAEPPGADWPTATVAPTPPSWLLADVVYESAWTFPPLEEAVADARRKVVGACEEYGLAHLSDDAALLTSEVVTNAVRHASRPIDLHVGNHRGGVVVAVSDDSEVIPKIGELEQYAERGRGMRLVDALAVQWGIERGLSTGKTVWFHLATVAGNTATRH